MDRQPSEPRIDLTDLIAALAFRGHLRESARALAYSRPRFRRWYFSVSHFFDLAVFGAVPRDTASAVARGLLARDAGYWALGWWGAERDTNALRSLRDWAVQAGRRSESEVLRERAHFALGATAAYLALAEGDSAAALADLLATPDSLAPEVFAVRLLRSQLLARLGREREAARLLEGELLYAGQMTTPAEVLWILERGRVNERLGNRSLARTAYRFVADVWRNADPELQPYVAEARAALARLRE